MNAREAQIAYRMARQCVKRWDDRGGVGSEDIIQQTMIRLMRSVLLDWNNPAVVAIVRKQVYLAMVDCWRKQYGCRNKRRRLPLLFSQTEGLSSCEPAGPSGESVCRQVDARDVMQRKMRGLSRTQRLVLALRYGDGFSIAETARVVGVSECRCWQILRQLREQINMEVAKA